MKKRIFMKILSMYRMVTFLWLLLLVGNNLCMEFEFKAPHNKQIICYDPWREAYTTKTVHEQNKSNECVFCVIPAIPHDPQKRLILRGKYNYVAQNTNPFVNGESSSLLVIPFEHGKYPHELLEEITEECIELMAMIFNKLQPYYMVQINNNIGANAGASIPNHSHTHLTIRVKKPYYSLIKAMKDIQPPRNVNEQYAFLTSRLTADPLYLQPPLSQQSHCSQCYYCKIINSANKEENLVVYQNHHVTIMMNHRPFCMGHMTILPNNHYSDINHAPKDMLNRMYKLALQLYPAIIKYVNFTDANIGMTSYSQNSGKTQHLEMHVVPRKAAPSISPVLNMYYVHQNVILLYKMLVEFYQAS
jgi:diadenosine tetraphosphate (Ap4A) HIT family hydrolase